MKFQSLALVASAAWPVAAFPQIGRQVDSTKVQAERWYDQKRAEECPFAKRAANAEAEAPAACPFASMGQAKEKRAATFDAEKQRVSVSGEHAFRAPDKSKGDQRGKNPMQPRPKRTPKLTLSQRSLPWPQCPGKPRLPAA